MSNFIERSSSVKQFVNELVYQTGLNMLHARQFMKCFDAANQKRSFSAKRREFVHLIIPQLQKMERISQSQIEEAQPPEYSPEQLEMIYYRCMRSFDEIFDQREPCQACIDMAYDQGFLTAGAANQFPLLLEKAALSVIQNEENKSFSSLLERASADSPLVLFAERMKTMPQNIQITDSEIDLLVKLFHCTFSQEGMPALRKGFQSVLEIYFNILSEHSHSFEAQGKRKMAAIINLKIDANRYWFQKIYDEVELSRDPFACWIDKCVECGMLSLSAANDTLDLAETNLIKPIFALIKEACTSVNEGYEIWGAGSPSVKLHRILSRENIPNPREAFKCLLQYHLQQLRDHNSSVNEPLLQLSGESSNGPGENKPLIPRKKIEIMNYRLLRLFDEERNCRKSFACWIDELVDQGLLSMSTATEILNIADASKTEYQFAQRLLSIREYRKLPFSVEEMQQIFYELNGRDAATRKESRSSAQPVSDDSGK